MKERIIEFALSKGLDIKFAPVVDLGMPDAPLVGEAKNIVFNPREIMSDAKTVILLFAPYSPSVQYREGFIHLSEYYRVSNESYHASKKVACFIQSLGAKAIYTSRLSAKKAALLSGGFIGKNGFYFHEKFGSLVCIHTVLTDLYLAEEYPKGLNLCKNCSICYQSCPSGAVKQEGGVELAKCIRNFMNDTVPAELRKNIYQLLGCEKCQICCPANKAHTGCEPAAFSLEKILAGEKMNELQLLAGKNMARQKRILSQAILFAGAKNVTELKPYIEKYALSETNSIKEHARWSLKRLNDEL